MSWILIHLFGWDEDLLDPRHQGQTLEVKLYSRHLEDEGYGRYVLFCRHLLLIVHS